MSNAGAPSKTVSKKLIVLCDGTWQNSDFGWEKDQWWNPFDRGHAQIPTNVTRISRAICHEDDRHVPQVVSYHAGVGSSSWSITDHLLGGGLAYGISSNIREAYDFIAQNYMENRDGVEDEIYLLGFSRGAFTARSVGGMISTIGLLTKEGMENFYYIFEDYELAGSNTTQPLKIQSVFENFNVKAPIKDAAAFLAEYKQILLDKHLTREVPIKAIAVWDTVGTLGLPVHPLLQKIGLPSSIHKYRFFDTGIAKNVENAFHALALDEHRAAFNATVWERQPDNDHTTLKQVWFPGAHSNIGGGYGDTSMADLTLAWMMDQLSPFIKFNTNYLVKQFDANRKKNYAAAGEKPSKMKPLWQWGLGLIYESLTFPTSIAGATTRSPGRYCELDYETGRPDTKNPTLLQNTNEHIHASVRARYFQKGLRWDGKPYQPTDPLVPYKHEFGKPDEEGYKPALWKCDAQKDLANGKILPEAPIGQIEWSLLQKDSKMMNALFNPHDPTWKSFKAV